MNGKNIQKKEFPEIILVCPDEGVQNWLTKKVKSLRIEENPHFYVSTWEKVQTKGMRKETIEIVSIVNAVD